MQYLTFQEYQEIGGVLDLTAFNRNIVRACGILDNETHGRLLNVSVVSDRVKHCLRELIEYGERHSAIEERVTSRSQSAGGVSESESYESKSADDVRADISNIVYDYLLNEVDDNGVSLLYRG